MTKGTDNKDEFDFSEFDETDDNKKEKASKASLSDENKDDLDDIFSGDFDFSGDETSNNEDIPILTDFVSKDESADVIDKNDDFDEFSFDEMDAAIENTSTENDTKVDTNEFDFSELDSSMDLVDVNDDDVVLTDDFNFDELDNSMEDIAAKSEENKSIDEIDEFNFDELDSITDIVEMPVESKNVKDDFSFDELDELPVTDDLKNEDTNKETDFDFSELDSDPTVDSDLVFNEPESDAPIVLEAIKDDFDVSDDFDFEDDALPEVNAVSDISVDFDFEETTADNSVKESNENVSVSNDDFDFDDDVLSKDFNNEETLVDANNLNDDFDFEEFDNKETSSDNKNNDLLFDEVQNDFEEILEHDAEPTLPFDETPVVASAESNEFDFNFDDEINANKVDESKDLVNNDIYNNNGDKGMSDKKDTNEFDFDDSNDFDFGDEGHVAAKKDNKEDDFNEFDFGNDTVNTKDDDFDTKFDMDDKDDFDFGAPKNDNEHENDFGLNADSHEEQEEEVEQPTKANKKDKKSKVKATDDSDSSEKKQTSPIFKYTMLALAVALIGGAGFIGYTKFFPSYEEEDEETVQQPVVKHQAPAKKEVKKEVKAETPVVKPVEKTKTIDKDTSNDLADLDSLSASTPVKPARQESVAAPVANNVNNVQMNQDYEKLQGQFASVIGSVSKMSNEIESLKSDNQRMQNLLNKVKADGNNSDFESFQLDFSTLKNEVNGLKKQVTEDKEFSKETMMKFLTISKKLKEEVSNLKGSQVNKEEIDGKLNELNELSKQVELLNTKVANNEVMSKIANLEKNLNDKKLQEVETKLNKTEKDQTSSSNKQKSVLELLEEKNKEKDLEKNTVVVDNDDDDLKVPLSVTIEEDSEDSPKPVVKKQTVKKKTNHEYFFIGTIEGVVYLKSASGSISEYRVNEQLPGYGEILKIYKDGSIETENGNVKFKEK